mmetsp:Transcript_52344/g.98216  ORF Transcript_52344/g.98216 Transcript_52344/m.98216 type:complete len:87 (-) Transcript_52344:30-290(-)
MGITASLWSPDQVGQAQHPHLRDGRCHQPGLPQSTYDADVQLEEVLLLHLHESRRLQPSHPQPRHHAAAAQLEEVGQAGFAESAAM